MFSPFIAQGAGIERFLRKCHPGMLVALPDLHRAMQGSSAPEQVMKWMTDVSGLPVKLITRLYAMGSIHMPESIAASGKGSDSIQAGGISNDRSAEG